MKDIKGKVLFGNLVFLKNTGEIYLNVPASIIEEVTDIDVYKLIRSEDVKFIVEKIHNSFSVNEDETGVVRKKFTIYVSKDQESDNEFMEGIIVLEDKLLSTGHYISVEVISGELLVPIGNFESNNVILYPFNLISYLDGVFINTTEQGENIVLHEDGSELTKIHSLDDLTMFVDTHTDYLKNINHKAVILIEIAEEGALRNKNLSAQNTLIYDLLESLYTEKDCISHVFSDRSDISSLHKIVDLLSGRYGYEDMKMDLSEEINNYPHDLVFFSGGVFINTPEDAKMLLLEEGGTILKINSGDDLISFVEDSIKSVKALHSDSVTILTFPNDSSQQNSGGAEILNSLEKLYGENENIKEIFKVNIKTEEVRNLINLLTGRKIEGSVKKEIFNYIIASNLDQYLNVDLDIHSEDSEVLYLSKFSSMKELVDESEMLNNSSENPIRIVCLNPQDFRYIESVKSALLSNDYLFKYPETERQGKILIEEFKKINSDICIPKVLISNSKPLDILSIANMISNSSDGKLLYSNGNNKSSILTYDKDKGLEIFEELSKFESGYISIPTQLELLQFDETVSEVSTEDRMEFIIQIIPTEDTSILGLVTSGRIFSFDYRSNQGSWLPEAVHWTKVTFAQDFSDPAMKMLSESISRINLDVEEVCKYPHFLTLKVVKDRLLIDKIVFGVHPLSSLDIK